MNKSNLKKTISDQNNLQVLSRVYRKSSLLGKTLQSVLVYFKLSNFEILREWFPLYSNVWEVQQKIASNINVAPGNILLKFNGEKLHPWIPLAGLDYENRVLFIFDVEILKDPLTDSPEGLPKMIVRTVQIYNNLDNLIELTVLIEVEKNKKQWLGGLRHKITGVEYHHAAVQTMPRGPRSFTTGELAPEMLNSYSQTPKFTPKDDSTQTRHDHGTQMPKPGLYMQSHRDRILEPGNYNPYLPPKPKRMPDLTGFNKFKKLCLEVIRQTKEERIKRKREHLLQIRKDIHRKHAEKVDWNFALTTLYPTDRYGFENLYQLVNKWYDDERKKSLEHFILPSDPGFIAYMIEVFKQKLSYYRQIDVLRTKCNVETSKKKKMLLFEESSKPKITYYEKGNITITETCAVQRSKVLKEMYSSYIKEDYVKEERTTMLLELKVFLETNVPVDLAMPMTELINREIDCMSMGIKHLEGLRLRLAEYLFYYFTLIDFDGEESFTTRKLDEPATMCISCCQLKPKKAFFQRNRYEQRYCRSCVWLRRRNTGVRPMGTYKMMLDEMKKAEPPDEKSVLTLMEPEELFLLANKIWNGRSAISGCSDPDKLWLAKWQVDKPWAPWNCILLTVDEARVHEKLKFVKKFYDPIFLNQVQRRHLEAKIEFKQLQKAAEELQKRKLLNRPQVPKERMKEVYEEDDPFFKSAILRIRRRTLTYVSK